MKRAKFNLSHYKLLTCDMGELVPVALTEVLPGDTFQQSSAVLLRVSPLLAPVMHPVHVRIHHWFVPHRIVWDQWEAFITGGADGMDDSEFPTLDAGAPGVGSLADYLGVPPDLASGAHVSALPFRGYSLIWNEWYRDQDLQSPLAISKDQGVDSTTNVTLQNVAWEKDYFTSARPWTQKGPDVTIPLGSTAPVIPEGSAVPTFDVPGVTGSSMNVLSGDATVRTGGGVPSGSGQLTWNTPHLQTDLSSAVAANINDLRRAFALQRYEEARARYGSRYTEYLRYLGVRSSDARLQRPEYLGGGKQTIQFSEVLQTGPDSTDDGVANLKGHGIAAVRSNRYRRFFEEHGYVFSLMSVKPKTMYGQALHRTWNRRTKEDFWQRELQHIGQQEILNKELYAAHATPEGVFGYQDRYDEYRRCESGLAAEFRTDLDFWHYARLFASDPALNADFIKSVPTKRVNAVETNDVLWCMVNHRIAARRMVAPVASSFIY